MCDPFDNQAPASWRADLFALIAATPNLDWLLLTKRPQNITKMLPADWDDGYANVWLGATTENQAEADRRIPLLQAVPAAIRFLSVEPLLEQRHARSARHPLVRCRRRERSRCTTDAACLGARRARSVQGGRCRSLLQADRQQPHQLARCHRQGRRSGRVAE